MFGGQMNEAVAAAVASGFPQTDLVLQQITRATGVMGFLFVGVGVAMAGTLLRVLFRHGGVLVEHTSGMMQPVHEVDDWDAMSADDRNLYRQYAQDAWHKEHGWDRPAPDMDWE